MELSRQWRAEKAAFPKAEIVVASVTHSEFISSFRLPKLSRGEARALRPMQLQGLLVYSDLHKRFGEKLLYLISPLRSDSVLDENYNFQMAKLKLPIALEVQ